MQNRSEVVAFIIVALLIAGASIALALGYQEAAGVLLVLIACGVVVTKVIDALKASGAIPDGKAGHWNQGISFVVAIILFVLKWFGLDTGIPDAERVGVEIATFIASTGGIAVLARLFHILVNWIQESQKPPKSIAPATVEIKTDSVSVQQ